MGPAVVGNNMNLAYDGMGIITQQNSYFLNHVLDTVTTWWLDSDSVVTVANCQQHDDQATNGSVVTMLPAVNNSDIVTVQSQCSPRF